MKGILVVLKKEVRENLRDRKAVFILVTGTDPFSSAVNWNDMARHLSPD